MECDWGYLAKKLEKLFVVGLGDSEIEFECLGVQLTIDHGL
jgi:hypothetical protein